MTQFNKIISPIQILPRANHPYHLVEASPWPFLMSFSLLSFAIGLVTWLNHLHPNLLPHF
jgi:hypothetical protein